MPSIAIGPHLCQQQLQPSNPLYQRRLGRRGRRLGIWLGLRIGTRMRARPHCQILAVDLPALISP